MGCVLFIRRRIAYQKPEFLRSNMISSQCYLNKSFLCESSLVQGYFLWDHLLFANRIKEERIRYVEFFMVGGDIEILC